ncbi:MAG: outer membrane lipoprotein-sorting protein [Treponema sp.]|nr:outer membrane lipoprotein-sorting protein [Treponema sp.]
MKLKSAVFAVFMAVFMCLPVFSITKAESERLLQLAEDNSAFYETDFSGNYTVVQEKPGEGKNITEAVLYRRDKSGKWTILITGPVKEKGKGYLQYDDNIWFYDPADNRFTFTSAKDKFQNTNANNSDFTPQHYARDYSIKSFEEVKLGNMDCVLFELTAKVENVTYPILKIWVTKDDGLVRKKEDYSLSGQKLRTTGVPSYQIVKTANRTYSVPESMVIQDNLRGKKIGGKLQYEKTQITIKNISFEKVSDTVYTKPYLEKMGSK